MKLYIHSILLCLLIISSCNNRKNKVDNNKQSEKEMVIPSEFEGEVIGIIDGDTIDVLFEETSVRIRLHGIDCPEKGQAYGKNAKEFISTLCFRKRLKVRKVDTDRYSRLIADCWLTDGTNVNYALVENGFAWHFAKYSNDEQLAILEQKAKAQRLGLWADDEPIAPWEWRKR